MKKYLIEKAPIHFLKLTTIIMIAPALMLAFYALPWLTLEILDIAFPEALLFYGFILGVYILLAFYAHGVLVAFKILLALDKNMFYEKRTLALFQKLLKDALAVALICIMLAIPLFIIAQLDDAPGLVLIGMLTGYGALLVAAVSKCFMHAIAKTEVSVYESA